jgi:hypothetical protein
LEDAFVNFGISILIESSGGADPLASYGHAKADAQLIRALVEEVREL